MCTPAQLDLFGWRIPFLLVIFSFTLAVMLRLNMPEPLELIARARLAAEANASAGGAENGVATPAAGAPQPATSAGGASAGSTGGADAGKRSTGSGPTTAAASLAAKLRHRVPLVVLLRHHFPALVLFALVACYAQASVCECDKNTAGLTFKRRAAGRRSPSYTPCPKPLLRLSKTAARRHGGIVAAQALARPGRAQPHHTGVECLVARG